MQPALGPPCPKCESTTLTFGFGRTSHPESHRCGTCGKTALHCTTTLISLILELLPTGVELSEPTCATRVLNCSRVVSFHGSVPALEDWDPGSSFSLALLVHPGAPGGSMVERSQFFSRLFCTSLFWIRALAGARPPRPFDSSSVLDRIGGAGIGSRPSDSGTNGR